MSKVIGIHRRARPNWGEYLAIVAGAGLVAAAAIARQADQAALGDIVSGVLLALLGALAIVSKRLWPVWLLLFLALWFCFLPAAWRMLGARPPAPNWVDLVEFEVGLLALCSLSCRLGRRERETERERHQGWRHTTGVRWPGLRLVYSANSPGSSSASAEAKRSSPERLPGRGSPA